MFVLSTFTNVVKTGLQLLLLSFTRTLKVDFPFFGTRIPEVVKLSNACPRSPSNANKGLPLPIPGSLFHQYSACTSLSK